MGLLSKRLLSSQGRVQELWLTSFPFPRSHASAGTTIGSGAVGAAIPSMETFPAVAARSRFAFLSPQGGSFRAFSSLPSSSDEHNNDRTIQVNSVMPAFAGNNHYLRQHGRNLDLFKKLQQGDVDLPRELPMRARYLNTALLLPLILVYNKISSVFLLNLSLFWHINRGIGEIMADYVHQGMTRYFIMVCLRLLLLIAMKDVFLSLAF